MTATAVPSGESIASEGKGEHMYVEGQVRATSGAPVAGAVIHAWEADDKGEQPHESRAVLSADDDASSLCRALLLQASTMSSTRIALGQTVAVAS